MLLGIDVGGTFTDAVLVHGGAILRQAKVPTTRPDPVHGILHALDKVLDTCAPGQVERVVISSTIVTNALTEGKLAPVMLAVMPGPGMSVQGLFPVEPIIAEGYVDHRGKVITPAKIANAELSAFAGERNTAAVSGKFAVRNQKNEEALAAILRNSGFKKIFCGSEMSGELNFVRRTNSAYFSAAVYEKFQAFAGQIRSSLKSRSLEAPVQILKADGGTMPLAAAEEQPVEAIFTGPAASVLGIQALGAPYKNAISLDVGGTTTDIAFWQTSLPLMAKRGAEIAAYPTAVRAFHMRSLGLGGDSRIRRTAEGFLVGPERAGAAMALGGCEPTLSDALITLGRVAFGDYDLARKAMASFARPTETAEMAAAMVAAAAAQRIEAAIKEMLHEWSLQPVYTVNDVVRGTDFIPQLLIGVGGGAPGLVSLLGEKMGLPVEIPPGAMVANAIGAALSRPTLTATLRADTTEGYYMVPEADIRERIPCHFSRAAAEEILTDLLMCQADKWHLPADGVEVISYEEFPTIHNHYSSGSIISLKMQLKPGIFSAVTGCGEVVF